MKSKPSSLRVRKGYRKLKIVAIVFFSVVFLPYLVSRVASHQRRITVHHSDELPASMRRDDGLRIACYNIAHGRGLASSNWQGGTARERKTRLDEIADLLQTLDADVIVLNEVDFDSSWSFSANQAAELAHRLGYPHWVEQRNIDFRVLFWKWRFGNAILSKYPIVDARVIDLPGYSDIETILAGKKRSIDCTINVAGENIRLVAAHLSHRSEELRVRSVDMIIEQVASFGNAPTIIAGDLNSTPSKFPDSKSDAELGNALDRLEERSSFQRRPEHPSSDEDAFTFHSAAPKSIIDWILVSPEWKFLDYHVESVTLSDHRPVVADLERSNPEEFNLLE